MGWMYHLIGEDTKAARFSLEKASMVSTPPYGHQRQASCADALEIVCIVLTIGL